jgi:hypothetical protein
MIESTSLPIPATMARNSCITRNGALLASSILDAIISAASDVSVNQSPMQRETDIFPAAAMRLKISNASGVSEIVVRIRSVMVGGLRFDSVDAF